MFLSHNIKGSLNHFQAAFSVYLLFQIILEITGTIPAVRTQFLFR